jgi:hypothetical protein
LRRRLLLHDLVSVVNMRHEDVLELIKRDEAWELFSVPLYVGLWLNLLLLL